MAKETDIAEKAVSRIMPMLEKEGVDLVELEYRREASGWVLRLFIDREGGVTLDDCADISRKTETVLDAADIIHHGYNLEVSSPGMNRPLRKDSDFKRFAGKLAKVKTYETIGGSRNFKGRIKGCDDGVVALDVDGIRHEIPVSKIAKANLEMEGKNDC